MKIMIPKKSTFYGKRFDNLPLKFPTFLFSPPGKQRVDIRPSWKSLSKMSSMESHILSVIISYQSFISTKYYTLFRINQKSYFYHYLQTNWGMFAHVNSIFFLIFISSYISFCIHSSIKMSLDPRRCARFV
jgi:hypothetical protein